MRQRIRTLLREHVRYGTFSVAVFLLFLLVGWGLNLSTAGRLTHGDMLTIALGASAALTAVRVGADYITLP